MAKKHSKNLQKVQDMLDDKHDSKIQVGYSTAEETHIKSKIKLVKNNNLFIQSGGGVVYDSDPEKEYEETINKAKALLNSLK